MKSVTSRTRALYFAWTSKVEFTKQIQYSDDLSQGFDSDGVVRSLLDAFPEAVVDSTDHAQEEVRRLETFLASHDTSDENKRIMMNQIRGKAARNGPTYKFELTGSVPPIVGYIKKWWVSFHSDAAFDPRLGDRILRFLTQLPKGEIDRCQ